MNATVSEFRLKLYPKDFDLVGDFYLNTLGWPLVKEWNDAPDNRGAMFETGSGIIELLTSHEKVQPGYRADISLQVDNVQALWESLQGECEVVFSLRHNEWGDTSFCISDPEGFHITFFTPDSDE